MLGNAVSLVKQLSKCPCYLLLSEGNSFVLTRSAESTEKKDFVELVLLFQMELGYGI